MLEGGIADLHVHTNFSDGSYSPQEVVEESLYQGLEIIAITDHDTVDGVAKTMTIAGKRGIKVIPGTELSTSFEDVEIHLLGLFIDYTSQPLIEKLETLKKNRINRIYKMVDKLRQFGIIVEPRKVFELSGEGTVGRPHVAEIMYEEGFIDDINKAYWKYIGDNAPAYVPKDKLVIEEAFALIHHAGGVTVLAHPGSVPDEVLISKLARLGLDAIEAFYPFYPPALSKRYVQIAKKFGLGISGGSDCHGKNRPDLFLGRVRVPLEYLSDLANRSSNSYGF